MMIRFIDVCIASFFIIGFLPIYLIVYFSLLFFTKKPVFCQVRLGVNRIPFVLYKFRTMKESTLNVPTHLVSKRSLNKIGGFLRQFKLDEIPQFVNVLKGDMSIVGPRPCLPIQEDIIIERSYRNVFSIRPGITGISQINGIDMSTPIPLAETDKLYIIDYGLKIYFKILLFTFFGSGFGDRITRN